jgi:hypothetical protein
MASPEINPPPFFQYFIQQFLEKKNPSPPRKVKKKYPPSDHKSNQMFSFPHPQLQNLITTPLLCFLMIRAGYPGRQEINH